MLRVGMSAAHKGVPLVLRDSAPGLPKHSPPWGIEGEPGGTNSFKSKRPFEANIKGNNVGHFGHHEIEPCRTKNPISTPNIKSPHTLDSYLSPRHGIEATSCFHLEAHREGMQQEENNATCGHLHLATCHAAVTCVSLPALHCTHWLDCPEPFEQSKVLPHCMEEAFCLSPLTVCEMSGSVKCTVFMCMHVLVFVMFSYITSAIT
jgi:hypothetical protein